MLEDKLEELETLLIPYAFSRLKNTPLDTILPYILSVRTVREESFLDKIKSMRERRDLYLKALIRTFNKVIFNCIKETNITHIASIIFAETNYMLKLNSWAPFRHTIRNAGWHIDVKFILESEIHNWLIFLDENGKLPGKYDRLLGLYSGNVIK